VQSNGWRFEHTLGLINPKAAVRTAQNPLKEPPENRGDLPDNLSVYAIPESHGADRASWIAMNDEIRFIKSATTTEIAAIASQNQVKRLLTDGASLLRGRFPRSAANDNECGVG
jgi:hypothetical protein